MSRAATAHHSHTPRTATTEQLIYGRTRDAKDRKNPDRRNTPALSSPQDWLLKATGKWPDCRIPDDPAPITH